MRKILFMLTVLAAMQLQGRAQNVILQGFYLGPKWTGSAWDQTHTWGVPCPKTFDANSNPNDASDTTWFYDILSKKASTIAAAGFTFVWLPGPFKGVWGYYGPGSGPTMENGGVYDVGYGAFDDYDLGDKNQNGNYQTRYGSRAQLNRCVAMMRANGLTVCNDFVLNQRNGANSTPSSGNNWLWLEYKGSNGVLGGGRFPKYTPDFHNPPSGDPGAPGGTQDPDVPATTYPVGGGPGGTGGSTGQSESFFGGDFAPVYGETNVNGTTGVWCATQLNIWGDWLMKAAGTQGYRLDDAYGMSWDWLKTFVTSGSMNGKFSVTELTGSVYRSYDLQLWMKSSMGQTGTNFTMFDQLLEPTLHEMCETNGFWMGAVMPARLCWNDNGGTSTNNMTSMAPINPGSLDPYRSLTAVDPSQSVTVVNEVDSESPVLGGNPNNANLPTQCLLGYTYIMTIGFGTPCVSYKDWSTDAACYGGTMIDATYNLNTYIDNLIWCHKFLISGGTSNEFLSSDGKVYAFQKTGGQQAMIFINSNQSSSEAVTVPTSIPNGTVMTDYTNHPTTYTVTGGQMIVTVPANVNGRGYLIMAPQGISGSITPGSNTVTQEFDANSDLSIPPATNGTKQEVARIWVDKSQTITAKMLSYNVTNWVAGTKLTLEIDKSSQNGATNTSVATKAFTSTGQNTSLTYNTSASGGAGFYNIYITGTSLPATGGPWWFDLQNTYKATTTTTYGDTSTFYH
jgi:alpha-amylase